MKTTATGVIQWVVFLADKWRNIAFRVFEPEPEERRPTADDQPPIMLPPP